MKKRTKFRWLLGLISALIGILFVSFACHRPSSTGQGILYGEISDADTRQPVPARVYVTGPDDSIYMAKKCIPFDVPWMNPRVGHSARYFNTVGNTFTVDLPTGKSRIRVERGKEYLPFDTVVSIKSGDTVKLGISLRRWINMNARGWVSGEHHIHRQVKDVLPLLQAEDMNVAVVLTDWNARKEFLDPARPYIEKADQYGELKPDDDHLIYLLGHEIEGDPGALFFFPLNKKLYPLSGMDKINDSRQYVKLANETKSSGGYVEIEKPIMTESFIQAALTDVDFLGILNNHMMYDNYLPEGDRINRTVLRNDYPGGEMGYVLFTLDFYYQFLNAGFRIMPTAGSASFPIANPLGYNRIYVHLDDSLTIKNWFNAIRQGHCFVTNGPMLLLTVNDQPTGSVISLRSGKPVKIKCEIFSPVPVDNLEIILNGKVIEKRMVQMSDYKHTETFEIYPEQTSWMAARCFEKRDDGNVRVAHTAPVFIIVDDRPFILHKDALQWFINMTDVYIQKTENDTVLTAKERDGKINLYKQARNRFEHLLAEGKIDFQN